MLPPKKIKCDRSRNYLSSYEVEQLIAGASRRSVGSRLNFRNSTIILIMFRHGLRVGELVNLKWEQIDLNAATIHVKRLKNGKESVHPLRGKELRALRQLHRESNGSPYVFVSERKAPLSTRTVRAIIGDAARSAGLGVCVCPHMLRHSCGYYLANKGFDTRSIQDYLGHKNIHHTVRYTELAPNRFNGFWYD